MAGAEACRKAAPAEPGDAYHFAYHLGVTGWTLQYAAVTRTSGKVTFRPPR